MRSAFVTALVVAGLAIACAPKKSDAPDGLASAPPAIARPADDACGAKQYQNLVGQPRSAIPSPPNVTVRVACTTCPVTQDLRPNRLNFFFDEKTDLIVEVKCG